MKIFLSGDFLTHSSYAKTNREIARRLAQRFDLSLSKDVSGFSAEVSDPEIEGMVGRFGADRADVVLRRHWPPDFSPARNLVVSLHWEYGRLPRQWVDAAAANCSQVWHSSRTEGEAWLSGDFPEDTLRWAPLGFDPAFYYPAPGVAERKEWLFVGGLIWRKGADVAVRAFREAFAGSGERLRLHSYGNKTFYLGQDVVGAESGIVCEDPHIYITNGFLSESEMGDLYRGSKALLAPSRAEGFGLPQLEAAACGLPVFFTAGTAPFEFLSKITGAPLVAIPSTKTPVSLALEYSAPGQSYFEPDFWALTDALRAFKLEHAASVDASQWTWDSAVETMEGYLYEFA